jgi:hypothetical protein
MLQTSHTTEKPFILIDSSLYSLACNTPKPALTGLIIQLTNAHHLVVPAHIPETLLEEAAKHLPDSTQSHNLHTIAHALSQTETPYIPSRTDVILQKSIIDHLIQSTPPSPSSKHYRQFSEFLSHLKTLLPLSQNQVDELPTHNTKQINLLNQVQTLNTRSFQPSALVDEVEQIANHIARLEIEAHSTQPTISAALKTLFVANQHNATLHTTNPIYKLLTPYFKNTPVIYSFH